MNLSFQLEEKTGKREISLEIKGAVLCGYTGRNQEAVRRHIEELKKEGVKPPPSVPMFYPKPAQGVAFDGDMYVQGRETSGEIEYVLLVHPKGVWVGLGSDHTDRELERLDILKSKQVCPTIISRSLWNYDEIKEHWDKIEIRSWATREDKKVLYQESSLATILPPGELMRLVQQKVRGSLEGIAIYSGTLPLKTGEIVFADRFEGELYDPVLKKKLTFHYPIYTLSWFRD
ncbi:MAG: DUF2848 domain-containing protein [Deltaproteobacteria bacterium]|nr:DUF2848 domain-containing protein [Deltaproteobacteria bacterium]